MYLIDKFDLNYKPDEIKRDEIKSLCKFRSSYTRSHMEIMDIFHTCVL